MIERIYGWEAVEHYDGVSLSLTGIAIVFATLSFISLFIAFLPCLLKVVNKYFPEKVVESAVAKRAKRVKKATMPKSVAAPAKSTAKSVAPVASSAKTTSSDSAEDEAVAVAIASAFDARRG